MIHGLASAVGFIVSLAAILWLASKFWPRHKKPMEPHQGLSTKEWPRNRW